MATSQNQIPPNRDDILPIPASTVTDNDTSSKMNDALSKKKAVSNVNQMSREDSLPAPLNFPNMSNREDSIPVPLSNIMDTASKGDDSTFNKRNLPALGIAQNPSQSPSAGDNSFPAPLDNFIDNLESSNSRANEMAFNMNNLRDLGTVIRAPSFGGPFDVQPAIANRPNFARQGSDSQSSKEDSSMSSSKPSNAGNLFMSGSNADYVLESQTAPGFAYERQKNVESQVSTSKASELLTSNPPSIFLRAPSRIEVQTNAPNLEDSTSKQIGPSPLERKSPYTFDHSENPSPFMNINHSMKPMLAGNANTKINTNKFFDSSSPISQAPLMSHASPPIIKEDLRARGGIYNLQPKFETLQDSQSVVEIYDLCKEFDLLGRTEKVKALSSVNMNDDSEYYPIKKGEFVMIRGPSGGGKTTFLNLIGTADIASSGRLVIMGSQITEKSNDEYLSRLRLEKIGFVFQTFNLLATMSAYENVELPMKLLGRLSNKAIKQRTIELLTKVGLQDRMDHLPSELSGGEQQRVAIARALANTPEILLLDEPTGDLDTRSTVEVMNLLLSINNFGYTSDQKKCTMIMVTHNPDLECYADRVIYFRDGKLVKQVINEVQTPLELESYLKFLNANNNE